MRYAFLVAWREFAENVKTKGFWIGIFIFPLMIYASFTVGDLIEKTKSVRHYVLVDQSGELEDAIDVAVERMHMREVLDGFQEWAKKNARARAPGPSAEAFEDTPASQIEKLVDDQRERMDELLRPGGLEILMALTKPQLREDAGEFEPPRRSVKSVSLPPGIDESLPPAELAEKLKPYLRGDAKIEVDGENVELFAAVIVPEDVLEEIVRPDQPKARAGDSPEDGA